MCQYRPVRGPSRWAWIRERAFLFPCSREADAPRAMEATQPTTPKRQETSPHRRREESGANFFPLVLSDGAFPAGMKLQRANIVMQHHVSGFPANRFPESNPFSPRVSCVGACAHPSPPVFGTGLTRAFLEDRGEDFSSTTPSCLAFCWRIPFIHLGNHTKRGKVA